MPLRNLPTEKAAPLAGLIENRPGQVSSMAFSRGSDASMTLLAFAAGESVSEEKYFGDTLYYLVEGMACVVLPDARVTLAAGEVLRVPAHVLHAVEGADDHGFKLLQLNAQK